MAYKVYSIESRKGGVGKTTIALNLAKTLADLGYDVLLIDCDITGTPITEAASHSPFWKQIVVPISLNEYGCNLIQYFEDVYLKGNGIEKGWAEQMKTGKGKIHLLGSEIYDKKGKLIIDPRLLMDDLHSYWFVEMVKEMAELFSNKSESEKKAVILDNSPGYVGIGKSIREWLTSLGYDFAHFLLVSSLDEQDIESTISSAVDIDRMMCYKWRIAYLYELLVKHNGSFDELKKILTENPEFDNFFFSLREDGVYPTNLEAEPKLNDFVSVVLNKVPSIYHDVNIGYKITDNNLPERKKIIKLLFPLNKNGMPENIIEYDASISGQFIESSITGPTADEEKSKALNKAYDIFYQKIGRYVEREDKVKQSASLYSSFKTFKNELIRMGYGPLIDSLGEDLVNQHFVQDMISFVRSLGNVAIPEMEGITIAKEEIQNNDRQLLSNFIAVNDLLSFSSTLYSLFDNIYKKAGFSKKSSNKYLLVNLSLLFKVFLELQRYQLKEEGNYHQVLIRGYNDKSISEHYLESLQGKDILLKNNIRILITGVVQNLFKNYFVEFYQKMCYTLLRLIDCAADYQVIMNACRATIEREGRTMDSDLRAYVRSIVSWKTLDFNKQTYKELVEKPFEMQVVKSILIKLLLNKQST